VGAALGPLPFGIGRDLFGTYDGVLLGAAVVSLLLAAWGATAHKPKALGATQ
jgi:cyanate permease